MGDCRCHCLFAASRRFPCLCKGEEKKKKRVSQKGGLQTGMREYGRRAALPDDKDVGRSAAHS